MDSFPDIRKLRTALLVAVAFAGTFIYHHNFFYRTGGYYMDAGENAFLFYRAGLVPAWPAGMEMQMPALAHHSHAFFQFHFSPALSLFSLASYAFPFGRLAWFSFCLAASYATITWAMCSAVDLLGGDRKDWTWTLAGGAAGLALAFSGLTFSILSYPHLEVPLVAFGLGFLVLLLRGKTRGAAIFFALACGMREDAGFHLTAILFAFWVASFFKQHLAIFRRRFLIFMILAFASGITALVVQKIFFPLPPGVGSPLGFGFFNGNSIPITGHLIAGRALALWKNSKFLLLPVALTFAWAAVTKNWVLPLGWLVYLPWLALNFFSTDGARQTFILYHGFPFFFSLAWLALVTPKADFSAAGLRGYATLAAIAGIAVASASSWLIHDPPAFKIILSGMTSLPLQKTKPFEELEHSLLSHPEVFGRIGLDPAASCLFVEWAGPHQLEHDRHHYDTLVWFRKTMFTEEMLGAALRDGLFHFYGVTGAGVIVATRQPLPGGLDGRQLFQPSGYWLSLASFDPENARRMEDGSIAQIHAAGCVVAYGPYAALPPGKYRVIFTIDAVDAADRSLAADKFPAQPVAVLDVTSRSGGSRLAETPVTGAALPAPVDVPFEVSRQDDRIEFRVASRGRGKIVVKSITLETL